MDLDIKQLLKGLAVMLLSGGVVACSSGASHSPAPVVDLSGKAAIRFAKSPDCIVVQPGETLFTIAGRHHLDPQTLALTNGIKPPYTVHPGQTLSISAKRPSFSKPKPIAQVNPNAFWQWPARGPVLRPSQQDKRGRGVDIAGSLGSPVKAAAKGVVVYSGSALKDYGNLIIIKHNEEFLSAYAHNRELKVKEGEQVRSGQEIATMGKTGAEQVKLHFEIRHKGRPVDPLQYLPKP